MTALLNAIFAKHRRTVLWIVSRIVRDPQIAEDLAQETYLRTHEALERRSIDQVESYIFQTARNLALDYNRRSRFRGQYLNDTFTDDDLQKLPQDVASAEDSVIEKERQRLFEQALAELPLRAREAWALSYVEELSYQQIADRMGISRNTVYNDIRLVIGHCRDYLERFERG